MIFEYLLAGAFAAFVAWRAISSWYVRHKIPALLREGAQIVDVRTPGEYAAGHASQSRNIPLGELGERTKELDAEAWVIVCCASGGRSAAARRILRQHGFMRVFNAGSWRRLP